MADYLPSSQDGWLPLYVLIVGLTALGSVVQSYTTMSYIQRLYPGTSKAAVTKTLPPAQTSPATPFSARTFGTWNLAVGIVRLYAAYHMHERSWYQMSIWTNVVGIFHFSTEAFVYGTCMPKGPWLVPVSVASLGLTWHVLQYNNYVHN